MTDTIIDQPVLSKSNAVAAEASEADIAELAPWFHNLHLPDGAQTAPDHPLGDFPALHWDKLADAVPQDLAGWRVLNIGCNAGFYSFALAKRGAHIIGIDNDEHCLLQAHWAAKRFGLEHRMEFKQGTVYDLARESQRFDFVWFTDVFQQVRYPMLALDIVRSLTTRLMMFQTSMLPDDAPPSPEAAPLNVVSTARDAMPAPSSPKMAFIEPSGDAAITQRWALNHAGADVLLRNAGFKIVAHPATEFYLCAPDTWSSQAEYEQTLSATQRS